MTSIRIDHCNVSHLTLRLYSLEYACLLRLNLEVYREFYILNNESKTRSYVCLPIEDRAGTLLKLVGAVDSVLRSFRRAEYYQAR